MLKIKKVDNTNTKPDTVLWLEENNNEECPAIDIKMKLTNCSEIISIATISKDGLYIGTNIPWYIANACDFKTTGDDSVELAGTEVVSIYLQYNQGGDNK